MAQRGTTAEINPVELEKLAAMQCTDEEIGAFFGVTTRTIERRRKDPAFADILERGKAKGRISLRRSQLKAAEQGNPTMQIWLGKQYLGQTDDVQHHISGPVISVSIPGPGTQVLIAPGLPGGPPLPQLPTADEED